MQYKSWRNQSSIAYNGVLHFFQWFVVWSYVPDHDLRFFSGGSMAIENSYTGIGFQPWEARPLSTSSGSRFLILMQVPDILPVYEEDLVRVVHLQALPDSSRDLTYEGIKMHVRKFDSLSQPTHLSLSLQPTHHIFSFLNDKLAAIHRIQCRFLSAPQTRQLPPRFPQRIHLPARSHFLEQTVFL
jgi:hypothetical protein